MTNKVIEIEIAKHLNIIHNSLDKINLLRQMIRPEFKETSGIIGLEGLDIKTIAIDQYHDDHFTDNIQH